MLPSPTPNTRFDHISRLGDLISCVKIACNNTIDSKCPKSAEASRHDNLNTRFCEIHRPAVSVGGKSFLTNP